MIERCEPQVFVWALGCREKITRVSNIVGSVKLYFL